MRNRAFLTSFRRSKIVAAARAARSVRGCARWGFIVGTLWVVGVLPAAAQSTRWVVSWGASPSPPPNAARISKAGLEFNNQTLREIVHMSIGGPAVRVRFSNLFGAQSLEIAAAHVALRKADSAIQENSDRALTFGGATGVTIPPNAIAASDPVKLTVPADSDIAISIFIPHAASAAGLHYYAYQTSYVGAGDLAAAPAMESPRSINSWIFLAGVDVSAPPSAAAIAVFGDSRVDGDGSTPNANSRWPNFLAKRLAQQGHPFGVLNAGVVGNRVLHDAPPEAIELGVNGLSRFDRDALDPPGIKYVVVLEGIVDIGLPGTPIAPPGEAFRMEDLIFGMKQLIQRAHDRGVRIFGATQTPFGDATVIPDIYSAEKEAQRQALNEWTRSSHAFDGVIDFDKVVRDPAHPEKLLAAFDAGDHIHPSDAGYRAMAAAVDLSLFK